MSKRLVIDASVLRASGTTAHPVSSACREFLQNVLAICHRTTVTDALLREWNRHQSKFAIVWRRSMHARRKIVVAAVLPDPAMANRLAQRLPSGSEPESMLKDLPLIDAALASDRIVVSLDDQARSFFDVRELNSVMWINPATQEWGAWLEEGAHVDGRWLLGGAD